MIANVVLSLIRTWVPIVVGATITFALDHGVDWIDPGKAEAWAVAAITATYYTAVRIAEARFPRLGWLLGSPKTPTYQEAGKGSE